LTRKSDRIHGGAFQTGEVSYYFGYKLMDHDVVLVEVQYRLSALGWLSLDTDEVPGNAGLFDMIEGLRWVQKHIKNFGGDPNRVTIFGESAGAASVSALLLTPQARGSFKFLHCNE
jgi:carboxylesterase type B